MITTDLVGLTLPYPGLRPFEPGEAHLFFGRDAQVDELLRRLAAHRFLAIVGTSGCGKSSLVKAGLLPNLHGGGMVAAGSAWRIATMRPGADPIGNLAAALNAPNVFGTDADLQGELPATAFTEPTLRRGPLGLVDVARQLRLNAGENLLVLVDQFEEIFRFAPLAGAKGRDDAAAFVKLLLEAAAQQELQIYVVLTMRSDFIGDCARFRGLPEAINDGQYLVPRLTRTQLREAIEGPAAVAGATVSPTLVQALLAEVGDQDLLPILQHALMRTWTLDEGPPVLDLSAYEATGGMAHALSRHADEAFDELSPGDQQIAMRMFQRLTQGRASGRGTRRPSRLGEIRDVVEAPIEDVKRVIDVFRRPDRAFLMPAAGVALTPDSTIDISHESLMRQWVRLRDWTRQEYESGVQYRRLSEAAALHAAGRGGLWRSPELDIALAWRAEQRPTAAWASRYNTEFEPSMTFLRRSIVRRRQHRAALVLASVPFVFLLLGVIAFTARQRGSEHGLRVQLAGSVGDPALRALLLAELADKARPEHLPLYHSAATAAIPVAILESALEQTWIGSAFIEGGRKVARVSTTGSIEVRQTDGRGPASTSTVLPPPDSAAGKSPTLETLAGFTATHDGRWLGAFSDNAIYLVDLTAGGPSRMIQVGSEFPITAIALAADGCRLAAGLLDGSLRIWDLDCAGQVTRDWPEPDVLRERSGYDSIEALQFDSKSQRLAIGTMAGVVRILHVDSSPPNLLVLAGANNGVDNGGNAVTLSAVALSPDDNWLAAGYSDTSVRVWNTRVPGAPLLVEGPHGPVLSVSLGADSNNANELKLATGSADASARLWTLSASSAGAVSAEAVTALRVGGEAVLLAGHDGGVTHVAFNSDGSGLATTSDDGTTRIWRSEPLEPVTVGKHDGEIESIAFDRD
jgi:WD40 repeat protein/energy-coupling factor transporter ATP-binding protein EcfA2